VGGALLSGDLIELADILGLNTSPVVEKILDIHIFENAYIKVDFKNKYFVSVGAVEYVNKYHYYSSYETKPKELRNTIGPDGMETLSKTLKEIPVKELNLCMHKIGDKGALYLGKAVGTTPCLEELIIRDCGIGADGIASLFDGLAGNVTLVTLDASLNPFGDDGAIQLAGFINQTSIQVLDISSCNVGEEGTVAIASALRTNTILKKLSLYSPTPISQQSEVKLAKMLLQNSTLTVLAVNQPPSQPTFTFPLYYSSSYRRFKVCRMSTQALLTETSTRELYQGIKVSPHISSVELDSASALGRSLWSGSMEEAADILLVHQPPRGEGQVNIHMCGNTWEVDYRSECVKEKDEGLKRIRNIQSTPESWAQLTELDLKHQRLGGVGACLLAELLNQTQLQDLNLAGCGITEEGIVALASAISTNTTIKHLAIGGNQISVHGQEMFIDALSKNRTLVSLDIQTCKMKYQCEIIKSFAGDEEDFIRRIDEVSSLTKVVLDGCTPFGTRLEKENTCNENDRTSRSLLWFSTTDYTFTNVNTIECQLKPFQVTKICKK
jgi:Ran GTPase-activating protein (RanGAP) involved in mRNA processing and transport